MTDVLMIVPASARGAMATKLLEAAAELDYPVTAIRSQFRGFKVPEEVHRYLFPSEYDQDQGDQGPPEDLIGDRYDQMEFPQLRQEAKDRDLSAGGTAEEIKARLREADAQD